MALKQSNALPPPEDPAKQFNHYLIRALLCIALLVDGVLILVLGGLVLISGFGASDTTQTGIFSLSITVILATIGLPAAIITILLYLGYEATKLKKPY